MLSTVTCLNQDPASDAACNTFLAGVQETIRYAFQPIVNAYTGACYGFEALLREQEQLGFSEIHDLFDFAHQRGWLHRLDMILFEKAVGSFITIPGSKECRLFYNLDNRILVSPDYEPQRPRVILRTFGISTRSVCFELSELHALPDIAVAEGLVNSYREQSFMLAVDDFGVGFSGLRLIYESKPNLIKIDRFFIDGIDKDDRKRAFVASVVNLAHILGIAVVAEGIETETAFLVCKQIGCDLVQGYFIARPSLAPETLPNLYASVVEVNRRDRRQRRTDERLVRMELDRPPALQVTDSMATVFDGFRQNKERTFFAIVDENGHPLGIIRETELKDIIYSRYGKDLLHNKTLGRNLRHFLRPCPICDINIEVESILATYSQSENPLGIIIVEGFKYVGILSATSLLRVINEKNLMLARSQNPLTKLPGNEIVSEQVAVTLEDRTSISVLVYFDLDNFKPFNDLFGFRQGDRAILMFADLLRGRFSRANSFVGHIGGDDFFASRRTNDPDYEIATVRDLLNRFQRDAEIFYDQETRARGWIEGRDRDGLPRRYPLLSCSAAIAILRAGPCSLTVDQIAVTVADMKRVAKRAADHICLRVLDQNPGAS